MASCGPFPASNGGCARRPDSATRGRSCRAPSRGGRRRRGPGARDHRRGHAPGCARGGAVAAAPGGAAGAARRGVAGRLTLRPTGRAGVLSASARDARLESGAVSPARTVASSPTFVVTDGAGPPRDPQHPDRGSRIRRDRRARAWDARRRAVLAHAERRRIPRGLGDPLDDRRLRDPPVPHDRARRLADPRRAATLDGRVRHGRGGPAHRPADGPAARPARCRRCRRRSGRGCRSRCRSSSGSG